VNSIRHELTRRLLRTTLALLGVGLAALLAAAGYAVVYQFDLALHTKALAISTVTTVGDDGTVRVQFTDRFLHDFDDDHPSDFFQIWRADGTTLARSESLGRANLPPRAGKLEKPKFSLFTLPNGRPARALSYRFRPKAPKGVAAPELLLVVASDRDDLEETLELLLALAAGSAVLLAGATGWVVPRVLARGLAPLASLGEQAARIDSTSLATRFPEGALPLELQPIANRLNALLARLEQSFERERRFSADLAHELRTPIAELQSLAENALKWPEARDPATDREALAIAHQMEALVTQMLALARGEQGKLSSRPQIIALTAFVESAWRPFAARAASRGVRAEFALAPDMAAVADPVLLRSILGNLFDNAVEYTPTGATIAVELSASAGRVNLAVSDPAGALTAEDVARLFDRFWRKEAARSGGQHAGLGLSLARCFAEAMGWNLTAALDDSGCVAFTLSGPAAS
jgi:signal transduction histidine kinase